ncbi:MAG: pilus assembly protein PilM [Planctomycetaceae bacterium]|nr:pilus assembly protein PilM [Planctomycetaceae bacterium]
MFNLNQKKLCPIGVDLGSGYLRMAQLGLNGHQPFLHAAGLRQKPAEIPARTPAWQRWAIDAVKQISHEAPFKGQAIITSLPSDDVFIDPIKVPRASLERIEQILPQKIQKRLPFSAENAMFQHVVVDNKNEKSGSEVTVLAIATAREAIERHLAIYERAQLDVVGISIWPMAMIRSFTNFFCRRQNEQNTVAILLDVGTNHSNVVITRGSDLLFARVMSIGYTQLEQGQMVQRLFSEIDVCVRYFEESGIALRIERMIFLAGCGTTPALCEKVAELAQKMQIPAQIGDVLNAIEMNRGPQCLLDRRNSKVDWATTFGLSLEGLKN